MLGAQQKTDVAATAAATQQHYVAGKGGSSSINSKWQQKQHLDLAAFGVLDRSAHLVSKDDIPCSRGILPSRGDACLHCGTSNSEVAVQASLVHASLADCMSTNVDTNPLG